MAQSAMQIMYEEMMCYEYTIPLELIVRCKELIEVEKEQIINFGNDLLAQNDRSYIGFPDLAK